MRTRRNQSSLLQQARQPDQNDRADNRDQDACNNTACWINSNRVKYPASEDSPNHSQERVLQGAISAAFHDLASRPASDQTNNDPQD
jgi:hypothetical protein